ncbi:acyl-CoA dehydrogenase domain-containing protein [Hyphomonas adhaerens MHS-3]|uniref:Medium-chain specific acyl-CoA dehydrogenase, mitochondrial n=1 Tax=Hyphomonas adhaerens MHS-3 TaxID=1280949 RepID=A0A069E769_9PROT|nr:acyl-CoA dehydrogenase [Hyphomonas adhaerens]KCZ86125.1 acyl-CoA dehydrogenase domain-containing protein [Hyphomonas adhaerens MHS-3]
MVDFSLTETDQKLVDLVREENDLGRPYARELDRTVEIEPSRLRGIHPSIAGRENPYELLERVHEETSGLVIAEALMFMASANDVELRDVGGHEAFGSMVLRNFGSSAQKQEYGHLNLAIGITEPDAGSDPAAMRSMAKYDPETDEYVLNGEKIFISFFNKFDGAVTLARVAGEDGARPEFGTFVLVKGTPGLMESPQMRKLGVRKHELSGFVMQDVRIPASARLDADFGKTLSNFNHNRPIVAAVALASCRSLLDFTRTQLEEAGIEIDYVANLAGRSAIVDRFLRLEASWEAAWGTVMRAKWLEHKQGMYSNGYRTEASIAKALGAKVAREITQGCLEILGPESLSEAYLAEKWFRDVRIADIYEGAGEIQRILIAREIFGFKRELS